MYSNKDIVYTYTWYVCREYMHDQLFIQYILIVSRTMQQVMRRQAISVSSEKMRQGYTLTGEW